MICVEHFVGFIISANRPEDRVNEPYIRIRVTRLTSPGSAMSLIITIVVLVFITELISWVGKSVLLQFVHSFGARLVESLIRPLLSGVDSISRTLQPGCHETSARAQVGAFVEKSRTSADQCSGPFCKMGQTSSERG